MRLLPLLILLSLFVLSECAKESSSDSASSGIISRTMNWCRRTWKSVTNFFSGKTSWRITMFGKTFKIEMPRWPKSWSSVRRRSSKFGNTIKGDAASRAFFAIYINVAFAFAVYIYMTVRQFGIAMKMKKTERPDVYPINPAVLGTSMTSSGFGDVVRTGHMSREMKMEGGNLSSGFSEESRGESIRNEVLYDTPAAYMIPELAEEADAANIRYRTPQHRPGPTEQLLTSAVIRDELPSPPKETYVRYEGYEPMLNINEMLSDTGYTPK